MDVDRTTRLTNSYEIMAGLVEMNGDLFTDDRGEVGFVNDFAMMSIGDSHTQS